MEWILIIGAIALLLLATVGALFFLRQRREGTVRGLVTPGRSEDEGE